MIDQGNAASLFYIQGDTPEELVRLLKSLKGNFEVQSFTSCGTRQIAYVIETKSEVAELKPLKQIKKGK